MRQLREIEECSMGAHEILGGVFKHFLDEDYSVMFSGLTKVDLRRRLRKDGIGICVFPTIHASSTSRQSEPAESKQSERKVRKYIMHSCVISSFQSYYNAFHREHVCFTYFVFVMFTWLSREHSFIAFFYVSLSEKERCFGKSGHLCANALSSRVKPVAKRSKKSKEQASSSTPVLLATEARHQAADLVHELMPFEVCDAEEVGEAKGGSQASKNKSAGCRILCNKKRKLNNTGKSLREKLREKRNELAQTERKVAGRSSSEEGYVVIFV